MKPLALAAQTWAPPRPPDGLARVQPAAGDRAWGAYLRRAGYSPGEVQALLDGDGQTPPLAEALRTAIGARERAHKAAIGDEWTEEQRGAVWLGVLAAHLATYPPAMFDRVDQRPPACLGAVAFGERLVQLGPAPELGAIVMEDRVTAARWWGRAYSEADQAGTTVAAAVLYRLVGVAAPAVRLADVGGARYAVHPAPRWWDPIDDDAITRWADVLASELPADAWLGNVAGAAGCRARAMRVPGMAGTFRLDLAACLAFRGPGKRDQTWVADDIAEIPALLRGDASPRARLYAGARAHPELMIATGERIARVTEDDIRRALDAGDLSAPRRAALIGSLIGRRELVLGMIHAAIEAGRRA